MKTEINDTIGVGPARNNHRCRDYAIIQVISPETAVVTEAQSCTSCWQVGHDADHTFATVGETVGINNLEIGPAGDEWATSIKWEATGGYFGSGRYWTRQAH